MKKRAMTVVAGLCVGGAGGFIVDWPPRPPAGVDQLPPAARPQTVTDSPRVRARQRPPSFVADRTAPAIETDPRSPAYDPVKLSQIGVALAKIVEAEPRDPWWAAPMERMLSARLAHDIAYFSSRARVDSIDCRSSSCSVTVDVPDEDVTGVREAMILSRPGDTFEAPAEQEPPQAGWTRLSMPLAIRSEHRDVQTAGRLQQARRKAALDDWRNKPDLLIKNGFDPGKLPPSDYPSDVAVR